MIKYKAPDGTLVDPHGRPVTPEKPSAPPETPEGTKAPRQRAKARKSGQARPSKPSGGGPDATK